MLQQVSIVIYVNKIMTERNWNIKKIDNLWLCEDLYDEYLPDLYTKIVDKHRKLKLLEANTNNS